MTRIKFDQNTDYDLVESECWRMMSELNSKKCGCCTGKGSLDMCKVSMLLDIAGWEKGNRPDRFMVTIKNVYQILISMV